MPLKLFRQVKKAYDVYKRNKDSKKSFDKAKGGYEMLRVKGKSTPEGKAKVKMLKTTNPMVKKGRDAIEEGEAALKRAKQPGTYFRDTGEETRGSKRTLEVAKRLRDTKRTQRKMEGVQKKVYELKTPLKTYREKKAKGGTVKKKFPDLTGDGKVTRADILKGRGVFQSGGLAVDKVGNPKGKKKPIQITGWGKARH